MLSVLSSETLPSFSLLQRQALTQTQRYQVKVCRHKDELLFRDGSFVATHEWSYVALCRFANLICPKLKHLVNSLSSPVFRSVLNACLLDRANKIFPLGGISFIVHGKTIVGVKSRRSLLTTPLQLVDTFNFPFSHAHTLTGNMIVAFPLETAAKGPDLAAALRVVHEHGWGLEYALGLQWPGYPPLLGSFKTLVVRNLESAKLFVRTLVDRLPFLWPPQKQLKQPTRLLELLRRNNYWPVQPSRVARYFNQVIKSAFEAPLGEVSHASCCHQS